MSHRALMRKKLLEQIYDKMSDEEKRTFVRMSMDNRNHEEIMRKLESIRKSQSWWLDLGSNIAGNAIFDGFVWIGSKILKRL